MNKNRTAESKINGAEAPAKVERPTHGALRLDEITRLLKYFKETPMPHDVSNNFVFALSNVSLVTLTGSEA